MASLQREPKMFSLGRNPLKNGGEGGGESHKRSIISIAPPNFTQLLQKASVKFILLVIKSVV